MWMEACCKDMRRLAGVLREVMMIIVRCDGTPFSELCGQIVLPAERRMYRNSLQQLSYMK